MLLSFVQAVVACNVTAPRVCTLVQAKIRHDTRLWHYSGLKPTMFASSVQTAVASNVTAPRVCTLVLFICMGIKSCDYICISQKCETNLCDLD